MITIAIDPGLTGAIAVLNRRKLVDMADVPLIPGQKSKKLDHSALISIFRHFGSYFPDVVCIEHAQSMPSQGVASTFKYGRVFGSLELCAWNLRADVVYIRPQVWKNHHELIGADKDASLNLAREHWGSKGFERQKDHNRAEAALLGLYYYETYGAKGVE